MQGSETLHLINPIGYYYFFAGYERLIHVITLFTQHHFSYPPNPTPYPLPLTRSAHLIYYTHHHHLTHQTHLSQSHLLHNLHTATRPPLCSSHLSYNPCTAYHIATMQSALPTRPSHNLTHNSPMASTATPQPTCSPYAPHDHHMHPTTHP